MAACFVCPWGFHFLASELPRRHLIMFGFSFNSFLLISTFFWWPCFYSYSFMSQQNLSNKRNFPEHFHLEFSGFFRGSMPFIAAVLFLIKKTKKRDRSWWDVWDKQLLMQVNLKSCCCCGFRDLQLMSNEWPEGRVARSWGVWEPAKRPLNTSRTERNKLAQQTPWHHGYLEPSFRHGGRWTEPFQHSG